MKVIKFKTQRGEKDAKFETDERMYSSDGGALIEEGAHREFLKRKKALVDSCEWADRTMNGRSLKYPIREYRPSVELCNTFLHAPVDLRSLDTL